MRRLTILCLLCAAAPAWAALPYLYVPVAGNGLTVLNYQTKDVVTTIPTVYEVTSVLVNPNGKYLYGLIDPHDTAAPKAIEVVSTATNQVVKRIWFQGATLFGFAVTPDGRQIWVGVDNHILVICAIANEILKEVSPVFDVYDIAFSPDSKRAFVYGYANGFVLETLSTATVSPISSFPLAEIPAFLPSLLVSPDGNYLYLPLITSINNVTGARVCCDLDVISLRSHAASKILNFESPDTLGVAAEAITPDGKYLAMTIVSKDGSAYTNKMFVLETATNQIVSESVAFSGNVASMAITPDSKSAYLQTDKGLDIYSLPDATALGVIPLNTGVYVNGIAFLPN